MKDKMTIAIDCERNGLRGQFISIAVAAMDEDQTVSEYVWAVEPKSITDIQEWVYDNVLPYHPEVTHKTTLEMLIAFGKWWRKFSKNYNVTVIGHMVCPVETDLFSELYKLGLMGEFEGPYRFFDINVLLEIVTQKHDCLDEYVQKKGLNFQTHNPLEDAKSALFGYKYLLEDLI